ncbi:GNAT family N-acetyltransferase [Lysinibacillus sphaericus]|uniref:Alanine acetyltransferase n=4 Tax=Lysinibacillus TaxID=400634 RepID=A0A2S0JWA7_LYSSH|nr:MULTISPECIES: GNAT family protein [Lysinibacillus]AHN23339.1 alanine acetyltransferase [Lysinibacillus varians]AVK95405.1 alanine acetyltransferase [Lysinibacillus sphaericus]MCS1383214.1 GNAT family N-acetyltransferase [Lysinibacillus sphaericus]MED4546298.1 GNAT family protein [Lysinibacillus sphaericus]TKI19341.1 GNAT family N-acetyltransferase [Lysinibacillus sphaericus]
MVLKIWNLLRKKGGNVVSIQGEKCYVRTFQEKDAQSLTGLVSRNKYFWSTYEPLQRPEYYTVDAQYKKIQESLYLMSSKREFTFGIYEQGTNNLIGHIALYAIKRLPYSSAFVGYAMDEIYIGKGIVTEAVELVVQFAFEQIGLHRVEAYVSTENNASIRVLEKSGFQREGLLRKLLYINGQWVDHYMYARLEPSS